MEISNGNKRGEMSLKAYEDACVRAELFGQPMPDKEEFLKKHKHLDVVEFEEVDIKTAENTAMLSEDIKEVNGGLNELNTILASTQTKINKLKGVCGSLTNFFRVKLTAKDNLSYSTEPSYVGQTNYDQDFVPQTQDSEAGSINQGLGPSSSDVGTSGAGNMKIKQDGADINTALNDLESMQNIESASLISKATAKDLGKQITSQMSKLDQMISQADRAETSLNNQNKQLRSFVR